MGAPNIQQQLYLKTALNESKEGMFDHPLAEEQLGEGYHRKSIRAAKAGKYQLSADLSDRAEASGLRRGGASERTIKQHFNKGDYAIGSRAQNRFAKDAARKQRVALMAKGLREALMAKGLVEGSRGVQRLKRIMKSVKKNYAQGKAMIGTRNADVAMRELVSPESPTAKASRAALHAGVSHMGKKKGLRGQISSRTRAAAMRERGRAGLNPRLPGGSAMMSKNETGGYEHTENPKRVPSAVKTYRKASAVKRNMYR
jgi:hypothetical protein